MAKAHYHVEVPSRDEVGNPLAIGHAAHQYVTNGPMKIDSAQIVSGHPHDTLHVYADESPENDSHVKQIAAFVGELANQPSVFAAREGKNTSTWHIPNRMYQPGLPAHPSAMTTSLA